MAVQRAAKFDFREFFVFHKGRIAEGVLPQERSKDRTRMLDATRTT